MRLSPCRHPARGVKCDIHRIAHAQEQNARILHSPLRIRDDKMRRHRPMIGAEIHFRGNGDLVFGAVNAEHAMHLHAGLPARRNSAIDMIRTEADLGETCALEHVLCILRSRLLLPLAPLVASKTISPPIFPEEGSNRISPCFSANDPFTVCSASPSEKSAAVCAGSHCRTSSCALTAPARAQPISKAARMLFAARRIKLRSAV